MRHLWNALQVVCGDAEVDARIEAKVSKFVALLEKRPQGQDTAQVRSGARTRSHARTWCPSVAQRQCCLCPANLLQAAGRAAPARPCMRLLCPPAAPSQMCLSFYEKRRRQAGWFGASDERLYWEQW